MNRQKSRTPEDDSDMNSTNIVDDNKHKTCFNGGFSSKLMCIHEVVNGQFGVMCEKLTHIKEMIEVLEAKCKKDFFFLK